MKNIKFLTIILLFSSLLTGCGMKGPLYRTPATKVAPPVAEVEKKALTEAQPAKETLVNEIQDNQQAVADRNGKASTADINKQVDAVSKQKDAVSKQEDAAAVSKPKYAVSEQSKLFTPSSQLLAIAPAHFTLQLAAMNHKDSLQQFITKHNLPQKEVYIYQTKDNNKPRYVIIFGEYESRQAAKTAREKLPGSLANMDSWIKKYQLVHQELLLNRLCSR